MTRRINYGYLPSPLAGHPEKASLSDISPLGASMPDAGVVLLHEYLERAQGHAFEPRDQGSTPSCVGQATAHGVDLLMGVQIAGLGVQTAWYAGASAESIYALSRVEIGYGKYGRKFRGGGSYVSYAADAVKTYGCLAQLAYPEYDLSSFDAGLCTAWGNAGLPDELEPIAKNHVVKAFSAVASVEEAIAAIQHGFPVIIGSDQGFKDQPVRDADGFLKPSGSWGHAQCYSGYDTLYSRPGLLLQNSWGRRWLRSDNARGGIPDGSYWVDLEVVDRMIKQGDAITISQFSGFADSKPLDFKLI